MREIITTVVAGRGENGENRVHMYELLRKNKIINLKMARKNQTKLKLGNKGHETWNCTFVSTVFEKKLRDSFAKNIAATITKYINMIK